MIPSLIHQQRVEIGFIDRGSKETTLNEAQGRRIKSRVVISAQVNFKKIGGTEDGVERHQGIMFGSAKGYLVCRNRGINKEIKKGDLILSVNGNPVRWVVVDVVSAGHYTRCSHLLSILFEEGHF